MYLAVESAGAGAVDGLGFVLGVDPPAPVQQVAKIENAKIKKIKNWKKDWFKTYILASSPPSGRRSRSSPSPSASCFIAYTRARADAVVLNASMHSSAMKHRKGEVATFRICSFEAPGFSLRLLCM